MDENYQALANAVVELAAKDYMKALRALKRNPKSKAAADEVETIERFFRSSLFSLYTSLDPEYLIRRLREEAA